MDIFSGLSIGERLLYFIPPMLLLPVVMVVCAAIYKVLLGNILPTKIYNFLLVTIALLGFFIWAIPMNMGFYEFFRAMF
ncbi:hypothetical protein ACZ11_07495 [Lysinibacillus xylanilyticus]|uniref:Uncharacterized protein n=1 Tax=Lysinibacillus xylanilyticus TaxID=582475 RepID=A0A0K9FC43_9BACI|nr:hypothetical protein [Lysinibacillus xylanilyticus]KMY32010.1 hypothetical protein ACZ11_07495 [Lysinibacillus xylanilyticus]